MAWQTGRRFDYQFASRFVIGAFGDYDFMDLHGTFQDPLLGDLRKEKETGSWSAGGRDGYLVTPRAAAAVTPRRGSTPSTFRPLRSHRSPPASRTHRTPITAELLAAVMNMP
jgi:hypothetical protein